MKLSQLFVVVATALLLVGCEGDARDLTEPVEANRLNLKSLRIVPPVGTITPLFINPESRIGFSLEATNTADQVFEIDATNRRWVVSDSSIASINEDGFLTGVQTGFVTVNVLVGEVWAAEFDVNVSFGTLDSIDDIVGESTLQPCVAQHYSANGYYTDDSTRALPDVNWTVTPQQNASFSAGDISGSIDLSGNAPGEIILNATVGSISGEKTLTVDNSLVAIRLAENLTVPANGTLQLIAQGNYNSSGAVAGEVEFMDITQNVVWSIAQGEDQASISNSGTNSGLLSGASTGSALVRVACGEITAESPVTITEAVTQLSVDPDSDITLLAGGATSQLNISTGTSYDSDNDVTSAASWSVVGLETDIVTVSNADGSKGVVTPIGRGDATVRASYNNVDIDFDIEVN